MKLSRTMMLSLSAIRCHGGSALAEGGGWWMGSDGERLRIEPLPNDWRNIVEVGTSTIYALEDRGLLCRRYAKGKMAKDDTRTITEDGIAALAAPPQ